MNEEIRKKVEEAKVVTIEPDLGNGQGVVIQGGMILTAAHCLSFTKAQSLMLGDHYLVELLGRNGEKIVAEVAAIEPASDVAVLVEPDNQKFFQESDHYLEYIEQVDPLEIRKVEVSMRQLGVSDNKEIAFVSAHTGDWIQGEFQVFNPFSSTLCFEASSNIIGGTSGGPIVDNDGRLISVVSKASGSEGVFTVGTQPLLSNALPLWVLGASSNV
jgi:S1-C subfamily serine protease